jgi:cysteine desulfurase/selenocysteine lyase
MIDASIREDFPILTADPGLIYFDNACMTLRPRQVIEAITDYYTQYSACAGRSNHHLAMRVTEQVEAAREKVRRFVGAKKSEEIIFTRNTTEGLNLVAQSLGLVKGDVVVTSGKEHNSNLVPWLRMKESVGIELRVVTDNNWDVAIKNDVKLVSVVMTANLDGTSHPIKNISKLAHQFGAFMMVDGAQSVPHMSINVQKLDVDFMVFSAHKMCGPSGMGGLYGKRDLLEKLSPFLVGGDTVAQTSYDRYTMLPVPEKFEAGLQDYAGIIGLGAAVDYLAAIGMDQIHQHELQLNDALTKVLIQHDRVKILGSAKSDLRGGIVSFLVDGVDHHQVALMLDQMGSVAVRSGQHCVHSWFNANNLAGSVRASLYFYNTIEEVEKFVEVFSKVMRII